MEDNAILNKFDNDKLIDVVKNYKRYGYEDELRDYAIHLLEDRGWSREDLQRFGYLANADYDEAEKQYKAYYQNSSRSRTFTVSRCGFDHHKVEL